MWGEKRPTSLGRLSLEPPALAVSRYKPIGFASRALQRSPRHLRPSTAIRARTSRLPGPHVHSWPMFLVLGIGTEVGALLALLAFSRAARSQTRQDRGDASSVQSEKAYEPEKA
jgi:hypothetical protein